MKVAAFSAKCPYEIGDKIQVIKEFPENEAGT